MKIRLFALLIVFIAFGSLNIRAGWYECYNFRGSIGGEPVTMSIQLVNSYLDTHKKSFTVSGVYKRDNRNEPIKLNGELDLGYKKALLYESVSDKRTAVFEFDFSEGSSDGIWRDLASNRSLPFHVEFVSKLRDFVDGDHANKVEILQSNYLNDVYFVGVYSMRTGSDRAQMDTLKVLRRKDGSTMQTIDLTRLKYTSGNIKTIIFDNVEVFDQKTRELFLWNNTGRMGGTTSITFDKKTRKFRLHPKSQIEGPN